MILNSDKQTHEEGKDHEEVNGNFWKDYVPKLNQRLPSFDLFNQFYPKKNGGLMPADEVFKLIGGEVNHPNYKNACAARVSRALNYSGIVIPNINKLTFKGSDNNYYFLGAKNLFNWINKEFGKAPLSYNAAQVGTEGSGFKKLVRGKKGIYIMIPNYPAQFGASGHTDMYDGNEFNGKGYFNPKGGLYSANLWVLA